ncbi:MAG: hypothetical protein ACXVHB_05990 [Solirubrobacteraceae bacterium]
MASFEPLSPEVAYAAKGNIAYPTVGASAAAIAALAQTRLNDEYTGTGITATVPSSAITVVKQ